MTYAMEPSTAGKPHGGSSDQGEVSYDREKIHQWILDLGDPKKREQALLELRYVTLTSVLFEDVL